MKLCYRALNRVQVTNAEGNVRLCSWLCDGGIIGKLSQSTFEEIWHGERAREIWEQLARGDYSNCVIDSCPYLSMQTVNEHMVEVDNIPDYPRELHLAYERTCNYRCSCCVSNEAFVRDRDEKKGITWGAEEKEAAYKNIEEKLKPVLPHVKVIGANGLGELFTSKHILKMLSEWRPLAPREECHVGLETNGSLFDAEHWKQIENLGQYDLSVAITVMSFDEHTYQVLSGTKLPISQIESNLRFVKGLREQGIINHLQLATVVQERNFATLPEFTRRCIDEFGADYVRLRPFHVEGAGSIEHQWFQDVRCAYHPYHQEYLEIMKNPIFKHPKVADWSGGRESQTGELLPMLMKANREKALKLAATLNEEGA